jgi:SnoaL-like polyketide cyclase
LRGRKRSFNTTLVVHHKAAERVTSVLSFRELETLEDRRMSKEQDNKVIVGRWFAGFWGNPWNPGIIDELAAPNMLLQYSLHNPRRGHDDIRDFMTEFRAAFPDLKFGGAADLIAEGDYVVGRWEGGGTHTGAAFSDFIIGALRDCLMFGGRKDAR